MTIRNPARLLALSEREFRREAGAKPVQTLRQKFKGMKLNLAKFDHDADKRRGSAVRMSTVLLREDDEALARRVCENEQTCKTYSDATAWLEREARNLRKMAGLVDTAVSRLNVVLGRCPEATV